MADWGDVVMFIRITLGFGSIYLKLPMSSHIFWHTVPFLGTHPTYVSKIAELENTAQEALQVSVKME